MNLDFNKCDGLVPAIIVHSQTDKVLMLGYMNQEAFEKTLKEKVVTFYSRTKKRLWTKGESSGHFLNVIEMKKDCDDDTLLIKANPEGPTCHLGDESCFQEEDGELAFLSRLEEMILSRKKNPAHDSYTSLLFEKGLNKIAQKFGEESVELIIESKDSNKDLFLNEAADVLFHYMVLLREKDVSLSEVIEVLNSRDRRNGPSRSQSDSDSH